MALDDPIDYSRRSATLDMEVVGRDDEVTFNANVVGLSAYAAYRWAMNLAGPNGERLPQKDELNEALQSIWGITANFAMQSIDGAAEVPFVKLAQQVYEFYSRAMTGGDILVPWDGLAERQRWAWQAVVRHIVNILSMDDPRDEDLESHEKEWQPWVAKKCPVVEEWY